MAELAIGVISLASLFDTCVNGFSHIQLARSFSDDYERSSLELGLVQLRLYRWGEAVNISDNPGYPADTTKFVRSILASILNTLETAQKVSAKYASNSSVARPASGQDDSINALRAKVAKLIISRQKSTSLVKKTTWSLYHKEHFERLISNTSRLVTELVDLFPASQTRQAEVCALEVSEIAESGDPAQLKLLQDVSRRVDELVSRVAGEAIRHTGHTYQETFIGGQARAKLGDIVALGAVKSGGTTHLYDRTTVSGTARVVIGDHFGATKDVFDD